MNKNGLKLIYLKTYNALLTSHWLNHSNYTTVRALSLYNGGKGKGKDKIKKITQLLLWSEFILPSFDKQVGNIQDLHYSKVKHCIRNGAVFLYSSLAISTYLPDIYPMNKSILYWLRWTAVVPVAFPAALLLTLITRQVLYYTLFLFFPLDTAAEEMMAPLLNTAGFVLIGSFIAPGRDNKTLTIVFALCIALIGVLVLLNALGAGWNGYSLQIRGGLTTLLVAILGACVGASLVKTIRRRRPDKS